MTTPISRAALLLSLAAAIPLAAAPAAPAGKPQDMTVEASFAGASYQAILRGDALLPNGTILEFQVDRIERGRKVPGRGWQALAEVKGNRFEGRWSLPRLSFRPGIYVFEGGVRAIQPPRLAGALSPKEKAMRWRGSVDAGSGDRPLPELAVELCRPLVGGLRAAADASTELANRLAEGAAGKLGKPAWGATKGKLETALAGAEKALGRKELPYTLPSALALASMTGTVRSAMAACDAAAAGAPVGAQNAPSTASLPVDAEVTRALEPVHREAAALLAAAVDDALAAYVLYPTTELDAATQTSVLGLRPLAPEDQARVKAEIGSFLKAWPAFKGIAWKTPAAAKVAELMDRVYEEAQGLGSIPPSPAGARAVQSVQQRLRAVQAELSAPAKR